MYGSHTTQFNLLNAYHSCQSYSHIENDIVILGQFYGELTEISGKLSKRFGKLSETFRKAVKLQYFGLH